MRGGAWRLGRGPRPWGRTRRGWARGLGGRSLGVWGLARVEPHCLQGAELWTGSHWIADQAWQGQGIGSGLFGRRRELPGAERTGSVLRPQLPEFKVTGPRGGVSSRTSSVLMGLSGPGGLDYLVLNHLGATPAGTRSRSIQGTRWLLQVRRPAACPSDPTSGPAPPEPRPPRLGAAPPATPLRGRAHRAKAPTLRSSPSQAPPIAPRPRPHRPALAPPTAPSPAPAGLACLRVAVTRRRHLQVNLLSYVQLTSLALPSLTDSRGSLVVVSSLLGACPRPGRRADLDRAGRLRRRGSAVWSRAAAPPRS